MNTLSIVAPQGTFLLINGEEYSNIHYHTETQTIPNIDIIDAQTKEKIPEHPLYQTFQQIRENPNTPQNPDDRTCWTTPNCRICQNCAYWAHSEALKERPIPLIPHTGFCKAFETKHILIRQPKLRTHFCILTCFTDYHGIMKIAQRITNILDRILMNTLYRHKKGEMLNKRTEQLLPTLMTPSIFSCTAFTKVQTEQNETQENNK